MGNSANRGGRKEDNETGRAALLRGSKSLVLPKSSPNASRGSIMRSVTSALVRRFSAPPLSTGSRTTSTSDTSSYSAFGKILMHLKSMLESQLITVPEFDDLKRCMTDVCKQGEGSRVEPRLKSSERCEHSDKLLRAWGVTVSGSANDEDPSGGFFGQTSDSVAVLQDQAFNCRGRRSVPADIPLIFNALRAPLDLIQRFCVKADSLTAWLTSIAAQYQPANSYHNWMHAMDVFQFDWLTLTNGDGALHFSHQDVFVIMLGAISHDVGHTGTSNPFLINTRSNLATVYNDSSPLENMHASVFFQTLYRPGWNFLEGTSAETFQKFRSKIIDVILATDMTHHFKLVDKMADLISRNQVHERNDMRRMSLISRSSSYDSEGPEGLLMSQEDRQTLMQAFVHMADISNGCRPWHVSKHLVAALEEELFAQGDCLSKLGHPIMPMMDRTKDSLAAAQEFFSSNLVGPLLMNFSPFISQDMASNAQINLDANRQNWADLIKQYGSKCVKELLELAGETEEEENQKGISVAFPPTVHV